MLKNVCILISLVLWSPRHLHLRLAERVSNRVRHSKNLQSHVGLGLGLRVRVSGSSSDAIIACILSILTNPNPNPNPN